MKRVEKRKSVNEFYNSEVREFARRREAYNFIRIAFIQTTLALRQNERYKIHYIKPPLENS